MYILKKEGKGGTNRQIVMFYNLHIKHLANIQQALMRDIKDDTMLPAHLPQKCINIIYTKLLIKR
ncbi:hypothetical protein Hanom_Chr15g01397561 [Helianthus anomalus]